VQVVFQQADLDTCLAGAILGVSEEDHILWRREGATQEELADAAVLCLEAGGSGEVDRGNFDHHDTSSPLPPACVQAFVHCGRPAPYERLVEFTELVDTGQPFACPGFPNVSHLVSGIRFILELDPVRQLLAGVACLRQIAELGLDPFNSLPWREEWTPFFEEKQRRLDHLASVASTAELARWKNLTIGFAETGAVGAPGALYELGADVAVVYAPSYGCPPAPKATISGKGVRVDGLLPMLNACEPGWGGPAHGSIVGSPRAGTRLSFQELRALVESNAWRLTPRGGVPNGQRS
jgi:hypothetical protein